jgi:O-antigen ligase
MGSYVARLLPFIIGVSFLLKLKKRNSINFGILLISAILVVLSAERLAFAYFVIILIFYFFINFEKKLFIYFMCLFILLIGTLFFYKSPQVNRIFLHTYSQIITKKSINLISYRHELHYLTAYKMFLSSPLLGHGRKSFRVLCEDPNYSLFDKIKNDNAVKANVDGKYYLKLNEFFSNDYKNIYDAVIIDDKGEVHVIASFNLTDNFFYNNYIPGDNVKVGDYLFSYYHYKNGCNTHPHNIYLEFLSELGLIGFFFIILIFLYVIYNIFYLLKKNSKKKLNNFEMCSLFILIGLSISTFPLFPSGSYFNNWLLIITYFPVGLYLSINNKNV